MKPSRLALLLVVSSACTKPLPPPPAPPAAAPPEAPHAQAPALPAQPPPLPVHPDSMTADAALAELKAGNARYVAGKELTPALDAARRQELAKGQHPFAIVLSCSDSRVPPELLFNQGLGDLFVVRVAGNVADKVELGSLEYAAEHLQAPLVMVLGHKKCGAVQATADGAKAEGNLGAVVRQIAPAVAVARKAGKSGDELVAAAVTENVQEVAGNLSARSPVLRRLIASGKLKVAAGVYDLATGEVEFVDARPAAH